MSDQDKIVPFGGRQRQPDPARLAEFTSTARRLQQERECAGAIVDRALRETPRGQWLTLATRSDLHTNGALERLAQRADVLERDPGEALAIAELSAAIADAIPENAYPAVLLAQMRANAWKDRGRALCFLSRHEESLAALDEAAKRLAPFHMLAHDLAIVNFVRAIVMQHLRRFEEAQSMLADCRAVFREHGDWRQYGKCTLAAGNLLVRRGDYAGARDVLAPTIPGANRESQAIAHLALGWCEVHVGDPQTALHHFNAATDLHRGLGWDVERVRASYGIGSALLRLGRVRESISVLVSARAEFVAGDLIEEAALCGLELVEAHLACDEPREAQTLASKIVRELNNRGLDRRAVAAIASLKDAIAASAATPETARTVHTFVHALRRDSVCRFDTAAN